MKQVEIIEEYRGGYLVSRTVNGVMQEIEDQTKPVVQIWKRWMPYEDARKMFGNFDAHVEKKQI